MSSQYNPADDPRLTAYALGELHGEEREWVEQLMQDYPEARREVQRTREIAGRVAKELSGNPQRRHAEPASSTSTRSRSKSRIAIIATTATLVAGIAVTLGVLYANHAGWISPGQQVQNHEPDVQPLVRRSPNTTVTLDKSPKPNVLSKPPADVAQPPSRPAEDPKLVTQRRRQASAELATAQRKARELQQTDPDGAFRLLEAARDQVTKAGLDDASQRQLLDRVDQDILMRVGPQTETKPVTSPRPVADSTTPVDPITTTATPTPMPAIAPVAKPAPTVTPTPPAAVANTPAPYYPSTSSRTSSRQAPMPASKPPAYTTTSPRPTVASRRSVPASRYGGPRPGILVPQQTAAPTRMAGTPFGTTPQSGSSSYAMPAAQPAMGGQTPRTSWETTPYHAGHAYQVDQLGGAGRIDSRDLRDRDHGPSHGGESYAAITENAFLSPLKQPLSTFGIDVDTASYANVRRFLQQGQLPPANAVRIEEMLNYFKYDYAGPKDDRPFSTAIEATACPWNARHRLVRVAVQGKAIPQDNRPASNLVFLVDVSGSMRDDNKLPLVKAGLTMLTEQMTENDRVAIVTYADSAAMVLDSTGGDHKSEILASIERLQAGGSTNGEGGIQLAYQTAIKHFYPNGSNRVILCTDGDFNVGVSGDDELVKLIQQKAKSKVFLSVFGFGIGNLQDGKMEQLADRGNGQYGYVDSRREARKVFIEGLSGTLVTIAKDVKIQVEFNPAKVGSYRLIGYENRALAARDFNDDKKDAGEIGAGHAVTALYEIVPTGAAPLAGVDALKYQQAPPKPVGGSKELLTLKLRYKQPEGDNSRLLEIPFTDAAKPSAQASADFEWAAAVAAFGMLLRNSKHKGQANFDLVLELAQGGKSHDELGYRAECIELMKKAQALRGE